MGISVEAEQKLKKQAGGQPPSFYNNDIEKWTQKFDKQVKDREEFKKNNFAKLEITPVTVNTNLEDPHNVYNSRGFHTSLGFVKGHQLGGSTTNRTTNGDQVITKEGGDSEYKRVMERRKSRQSTRAPTTVDIDYAGNSARFEHIIKHREYT